MKIFFTKHFPFGKFKAFSFANAMWLKDPNGNIRNIVKDEKYNKQLYRIVQHERTHWFQQVEMLIVFFFLWYGVEWFIKLFTEQKAYRALSFEREARVNQQDTDNYKVVLHKNSCDYIQMNEKGSLCNRKWYNWVNYIIHRS